MTEERIGTIEHYYPRAHAAVLHVEHGAVRPGDTLHIRGHGHDFLERVTSLEMDHEPIPAAREGQRVGLAVSQPVHEKDEVFRVSDLTEESAA